METIHTSATILNNYRKDVTDFTKLIRFQCQELMNETRALAPHVDSVLIGRVRTVVDNIITVLDSSEADLNKLEKHIDTYYRLVIKLNGLRDQIGQ